MHVVEVIGLFREGKDHDDVKMNYSRVKLLHIFYIIETSA